MVHGLAAQSGGAMRITSQPGDGTTVELWLPLSRGCGDGRCRRRSRSSFGDRRAVIPRDGGRRRSAGRRQHGGDAGGSRPRGDRGAVRRARAGPAAARHQGRCGGDRPRDARHDRQRTGAADQAALAGAADHPGNRLCRTAERRGSRTAAAVQAVSAGGAGGADRQGMAGTPTNVIPLESRAVAPERAPTRFDAATA